MKKRHRQMAGKGLKDVTSLNKCSGCGRVKRAHYLCPHCVMSMSNSINNLRWLTRLTSTTGIKRWFSNGFRPEKEKTEAEKKEIEKKIRENPDDRRNRR